MPSLFASLAIRRSVNSRHSCAERERSRGRPHESVTRFDASTRSRTAPHMDMDMFDLSTTLYT